MLFGITNAIVISLDVEKYLKELTDIFCQNESHVQLFDNVIQPPLFPRFLPDVFLWSPVKQLPYSYFVQFMVVHYKSQYGQYRLERTVIRIQGLYMDSKKYFIDPTNLYMPQCEVSSLLFCLPIVMQHPKVKNLALHFPFKKYHRSMCTIDLIEYIFTQIINGVNFLPIAESTVAMHFSRYVKDTSDVNVAKFNNNTIYSYPSPDGIEATFLDIFNDLRDEFCSTLALPAKSISVDHTFKIGKPIGGHREQDNKFIKRSHL